MSRARIQSIDILRALTMLLMIFVNDLWTLEGIPGWLGHKAAGADGLGLADVVFPAFLFIVGLSIPHAIGARRKKGDTPAALVGHILMRSIALWIMGLMMVNLEYMDRDAVLIGPPVWQILMALSFFLIWNNYPRKPLAGIHPRWWKLSGWIILVFLAAIYRSPEASGHQWMQLHWWGILGLIGWAYFLGAMVYLASGNRPAWIAIACTALILLNINEFISPFPFSLKLVVSASNYALVMLGILVTSVMIRLQGKELMKYLLPFLILLAALLLLVGFGTRPLWGISKIRATPSWTLICAAAGILSFALLYLLSDKWGFTRWARIIKPAGTSTLTCYLLPYYVYALGTLSGLFLPSWMNYGTVGIIKSLLFSLLIIQLTGLLKRIGISLKI